MPLIEQPGGAVNVLLLGSDQLAVESVGRTDIIIVVIINPDVPSVSLLSIPRDFYAWIPTRGFDKINTAFSFGDRTAYPGYGPGLMKATVEYNFGIRIHYFARVGFDGFVNIVDGIGGVDVAVECPLSDTFPDPEAPEGQSDVDWLPGVHHLDGKHALWYARSRWSTSDFDRSRRQQQVLRGLYSQIKTLEIIPKIPGLWGAVSENIVTDLGLRDMVYLGVIGTRMDMINVKSRFVGKPFVQSWTAPNGGYVLVPNYETLGSLILEAVAPQARDRALQPAFRVEVWNGSPWSELGQVAAERLRWEGFEVVSVERVGQQYPRTHILDFTTTSKGSPLWLLRRLYKRVAGDVVSEPSEERTADFRIVLGTDYNPCIRPGSILYVAPGPTPTPLPPAFFPTATP